MPSVGIALPNRPALFILPILAAFAIRTSACAMRMWDEAIHRRIRMKDIDRRSALAFGLAATSTLAMADSAVAQPYAPSQGTEIAPGVRRVDLGKRDSMIPAYKTVSMRDVVYQPKSKSMNMGMANDMVCHCLEGELRVNQGPGKDFTVKKGDVWSCNKGLPENDENVGSSVAIMRVIDLLPT